MYKSQKLNVTSGLSEVLRSKIWENDERAWRVRNEPDNPCYILFPYEVWENFDRKVATGHTSNQARRAIKDKNLRGHTHKVLKNLWAENIAVFIY